MFGRRLRISTGDELASVGSATPELAVNHEVFDFATEWAMCCCLGRNLGYCFSESGA